VESGALASERLASYRKLRAEGGAAEGGREPILAGRAHTQWKDAQRALRARPKVDPKLKR
jgi:hypothetical protein